MKSIGFFWTNNKTENEFCQKCPQRKEVSAQSDSADKKQSEDEFEFQ